MDKYISTEVKLKRLEEEAEAYPEHLCYRCAHMVKDVAWGWDHELNYVWHGDTTQDENPCPYIDKLDGLELIYESGETGNDRVYKSKAGDILFRTENNGMGYWTTACPFYKPIIVPGNCIKKAYSEYLKIVDALIKRGVDPNTAAENAGYILYAALGGEARKTIENKKISAVGGDERIGG